MPRAEQRVAVTGASGYIGRRLCATLRQQGTQVVAVLRRPHDGPWDAIMEADLGRTLVESRLLEGVDTLYHLAGKAHVRDRSRAGLAEYETVHVHGTRHVLRAARRAGVRCCVLLSSVKAMGEGGDAVWDEDTPCQPQNQYARTKLAAERIVLEEESLPCAVVLRPTLVYGRGSKGNLAMLVRAVASGLLPSIDFPPNLRSMIHVEDVVRACLVVADAPAACGRTYILTDGREYATGELLRWIHEALGRTPRWKLPYAAVHYAATLGDLLEKMGLAVPLTREQLGKMTGSARYSSRRIEKELGFRAQWDAHQGIAEMVREVRAC